MKNITQLVFKAKKGAIAKGVPPEGTAWFDNDDPDEVDALSTLAIKAAGFKRSDFFKPVRVDHLVVDDMPAEGVFDTAFCDRYKLAEDGKSWLLPVAQTESTDSGTGENSDSISEGHTNENATDNTDSGDTTRAASNTSTDTGAAIAATAAADSDSATDTAGSANAAANTSTEGVDAETTTTATDELPAWEFNVNGERMADVEKEMQQPVVGMDARHRILSQFILEDKFSHNITPEQLAEVSRLELDVSDNYIQDMLLATRNAPAIYKLNTPDLWKYTDSFKKVFARDKRHPLSRMINFNQAYADAHPIDRGLLVKEWVKGNYVSRIEKSGTTNAGASATPEPQKTSATIDPEQMVYMPKRAPVDHKENMGRVRKAGKNLRDIAAGRFNCNEEETQPTDTLADEAAAPEAVEPDTTKHYQDPQQVETESSVSVVDDGEQALREKFGEQLAAERGDFVPGISDPSDPKWVHNDYSASVSNEGEKTEVATDRTEDTADEADHSEEFSNQTGPETNHSESSTDHNEPETPETGPKSQQPEPVTKVADGVFDVSAKNADTSNQGERVEVTPPNNDDRSHKCAEEKATDAPAAEELLLHEIVRLQSINNQLLEACIEYQNRAETRQERFLEALFCGITRFAYQWVEGEEGLEFEEKVRGDS